MSFNITKISLQLCYSQELPIFPYLLEITFDYLFGQGCPDVGHLRLSTDGMVDGGRGCTSGHIQTTSFGRDFSERRPK
jgi:hypothetical protein